MQWPDSNLITAVVTAAGPVVGGIVYLVKSQRESHWQTTKCAYAKIVHLRPDNGPAVYSARVPRLDQLVEVFDETHIYRLNVYSGKRADLLSEDRSSGVVDLAFLHPYQEGLSFMDRGAARVPHHVTQRLPGKSSVSLTHSTYYNGLQNGNQDFSMGVEMNTREARLIVDFSSVPDHDHLLRTPPRGHLVRPAGEVSHGVGEPHPGVFMMHAQNLIRGEVLRMEFALDWPQGGPSQVSP